MEINVTHMVEDTDEMPFLSGSVAELGKDAGKLTWNYSVEYGRDHPLLKTAAARDAARAHFAGYGAWSREEIAAWSEDELQGITCQEVAASIREMEAYPDYDKYLEADGRVYRGDDGRWYFYLGT